MKTTEKAERIAKVLSRAGVASRRDAEKMILAGRVAVNSERLETPAVTVTSNDIITVDGKPIADPDPPRVWKYHKPSGEVTTARDEKDRKTVFDSLPIDMPRVMPIGRLDITSEGLLLLTNDGELKRRLELPSTGWLRRYRVRVHGRVTDDLVEPLLRGITVEGVKYQPMEVQFDRQQGANAWLTVALREGKNREIRKAMEAIGVSVNRLIRVSYGPFQLGDLRVGGVEEVRSRALKEQLNLSDVERQRREEAGHEAQDAPKPIEATTVRASSARRGKSQPALVTKAPGGGRPKSTSRTLSTSPDEVNASAPRAKPARKGPVRKQSTRNQPPAKSGSTKTGKDKRR